MGNVLIALKALHIRLKPPFNSFTVSLFKFTVIYSVSLQIYSVIF